MRKKLKPMWASEAREGDIIQPDHSRSTTFIVQSIRPASRKSMDRVRITDTVGKAHVYKFSRKVWLLRRLRK
jgi:hypothetical protein